MVTVRDNKDYVRILLYSYYTGITGWGGPPNLETVTTNISDLTVIITMC